MKMQAENHNQQEVDMQPSCEAQACISISQKLAGLTTEKPKNFIYRLHSHLRNVNNKAYEPEIIAIGPYHHDKDNVKMMEEHKLRYMQSLLQRRNENIAVYISAIREMEDEARECYSEPISLNAAEFTEMLVLDGCFIIELVRKFNRVGLREEYDPIFERGWMLSSLRRDLMLFENQIPFFILCKLFDLIEIPNNHDKLMDLALRFFHSIFPEERYGLRRYKSSYEIKHLLKLIHISWRPPLTIFDFFRNIKDKDRQRRRRFISSVTELRNANVKFKRNEGVSLFDIRFENGYLLLPPLRIDDITESFFRNLIAYEQYLGVTELSYVTDYVKFFDCLINSSADVEILRRREILDNWQGDDAVVSNMFNKLSDSVVGPGKDSIYSKILESMNAHCKLRRNKWMAKLKQHHLNNPWTIISMLAGIILLLLTATQTVFSVHK